MPNWYAVLHLKSSIVLLGVAFGTTGTRIDVDNPFNVTCTPCQPGFFTPKEGLTSCLGCSAGRSQLSVRPFG